jgi:hypothetical protein
MFIRNSEQFFLLGARSSSEQWPYSKDWEDPNRHACAGAVPGASDLLILTGTSAGSGRPESFASPNDHPAMLDCIVVEFNISTADVRS